jgi:DNA helicase IV
LDRAYEKLEEFPITPHESIAVVGNAEEQSKDAHANLRKKEGTWCCIAIESRILTENTVRNPKRGAKIPTGIECRKA